MCNFNSVDNTQTSSTSGGGRLHEVAMRHQTLFESDPVAFAQTMYEYGWSTVDVRSMEAILQQMTEGGNNRDSQISSLSGYISKQDAVNAMCRRCGVDCPPNKCAEYRSLAEDIAAAAAADVKPIVRATWIYDERSVIGNPYGSYACPICDNRIPHRRDFCPHCGADMRGEEDE